MIAYIVAYILLIGPINYFILSRKKRNIITGHCQNFSVRLHFTHSDKGTFREFICITDKTRQPLYIINTLTIIWH